MAPNTAGMASACLRVGEDDIGNLTPDFQDIVG
jgi:hypothetical protein